MLRQLNLINLMISTLSTPLMKEKINPKSAFATPCTIKLMKKKIKKILSRATTLLIRTGISCTPPFLNLSSSWSTSQGLRVVNNWRKAYSSWLRSWTYRWHYTGWLSFFLSSCILVWRYSRYIGVSWIWYTSYLTFTSRQWVSNWLMSTLKQRISLWSLSTHMSWSF